MRRKTYSEAMLENLHKQVNYWQEQARILREERDRERLRNEAITVSFEKMVKEIEEKNKTIEQLMDKAFAVGAYCEGQTYYKSNGDRLYTKQEVRTIINGTVSVVEECGAESDDILPEDFL